MAGAKAKFSIPAHVSWREVDGEAVILNLETSDYYSCNSAATLIWRIFSQGSTTGEAAHQIVRRYGVAGDEAETDVCEFAGKLEKMGLLDKG